MWITWALGCGIKDDLDELGDDIAGLTDTTVLQGSVLGVQEPDDPATTALLEATDFAPGTSATAFVSEGASSGEMASGLVTGADVTVEGVALEEEDGADGLYLLTPETGPGYDVGAVWTVTVDRGDGPSTAMITLPPAAEGVLDTSGPGGSVAHTTGTALVVDLSGRGYNSALIAVIGPDGSPTFTNQPETIDDLYAATQSDDAGSIEIPASAFPSSGTYAVGVAGLKNNTGDDFDGFNTVLSKIRAGEMVFAPLVASP